MQKEEIESIITMLLRKCDSSCACYSECSIKQGTKKKSPCAIELYFVSDLQKFLKSLTKQQEISEPIPSIFFAFILKNILLWRILVKLCYEDLVYETKTAKATKYQLNPAFKALKEVDNSLRKETKDLYIIQEKRNTGGQTDGVHKSLSEYVSSILNSDIINNSLKSALNRK